MAPEQAEDPHQADVRRHLQPGLHASFLADGPATVRRRKHHAKTEAAPRRGTRVRGAQPRIPPAVASGATLPRQATEDRFSTPAEVGAALEAVRADRPRRWWLLGAASGVVAAAAVAGMVLWISLRPTPAPPKTRKTKRNGSPAAGEVTIADGGREPERRPRRQLHLRAAGTAWTFAGNAGIQHGRSPFGAANAPDGDGHAAFLQGNPQRQGTPRRHLPVALSRAGDLHGFLPGARHESGQPIQFSVDGRNVGRTIVPARNGWALYTTTPFTIRTAGSHTIQFAATINNGDNTSFIDCVSIAVEGKQTRR